ncbi:MAG: RHS domain-containing protein [Acidovorax sp.]|uniref:RHS domain-containing protein n=1 Tax=Acidovorax sp. TaxID=1872122 RepID=UPI00391A56B8
MPVLQESRGAQASTYTYEPVSYVPLARVEGCGAVEPHALGGDAEQGKRGSVPTTNPGWSDQFNIATAANDGPTSTPAKADATAAATGAQTTQVYYFHTQPNGLPEELSDNSGNLVWQAQYTTWGSTVREEWQGYDEAGRPVQQQQQPARQCSFSRTCGCRGSTWTGRRGCTTTRSGTTTRTWGCLLCRIPLGSWVG